MASEPMQQPVASLFIGYAFPKGDKKETKEFIKKTIGSLLEDEDAILRIDIRKKRDEKMNRDYISIYIHIKHWPKSDGSKYFQKKIKQGKQIKIGNIDSRGHYWIAVKSNFEMPTDFKNQTKELKPCICDSDDGE